MDKGIGGQVCLGPPVEASDPRKAQLVVWSGILYFDGNVHTGGKVELLKFIHGLSGWLDDIDQPLVRALFESFLGFLVRVRRTLNGESLDAGRQRDGSGDTRAGAFDGVGDVAGGLVNDPVVKGLQSNANALSSHRKNNCLLMVSLNQCQRLPVRETEGLNVARAITHATVF